MANKSIQLSSGKSISYSTGNSTYGPYARSICGRFVVTISTREEGDFQLRITQKTHNGKMGEYVDGALLDLSPDDLEEALFMYHQRLELCQENPGKIFEPEQELNRKIFQEGFVKRKL